MIIIKIIIQYFIQIRHTDDFPSTGTRLVHIIGCNTHNHRINIMPNLERNCNVDKSNLSKGQ